MGGARGWGLGSERPLGWSTTPGWGLSVNISTRSRGHVEFTTFE